jgi:hypothetical protein
MIIYQILFTRRTYSQEQKLARRMQQQLQGWSTYGELGESKARRHIRDNAVGFPYCSTKYLSVAPINLELRILKIESRKL